MKSIPLATALVLFEGLASAAVGDGAGAAQCSLYLAQSTIENAGLGVFTGVPLREDDLVGLGDLALPITDIDFHAGGDKNAEDYHWLVAEYVWKAKEIRSDMESEAEDVSAFANGMGALPNCHFRLKNVAETKAAHDDAGVKRTSPGAGAFTPYHNRSSHALADVDAGSELFVDYGINWFLTREADMGLVPIQDSYPRATRFLQSFERFYERVSAASSEGDVDDGEREGALEAAMLDLWEVVHQSPYKSRPLSAVPKSFATAKRAFEVGIQRTELELSIRSLDYLDRHGKCVDGIRPGKSTIPDAGRGAFATKFIPKGGYVTISPLVHIPEREVLITYADMLQESGKEARDISNPIGHQLLFNYCYGHRQSSLLLCPYGPGAPFINHSSEPNAKIVWPTDPVYHTASWMDQPVAYFDNVWSTGMSFEYVATKDINEGDEVFVDYGPEWAEAWKKHIERWEPPKGAETYLSPQELNGDHSLPIPTHEEDDTLISETIVAWCRFSNRRRRSEEDKHEWLRTDMYREEHRVTRVVDRARGDSDGVFTYTVELQIGDGYVVKNVPRKALSFTPKHYGSDSFVRGVFRHEMMIPDEIFPNAWKNVRA
ncbi:hypothetical protein ACHAWF_008953 [Thalassiosira exigua]